MLVDAPGHPGDDLLAATAIVGYRTLHERAGGSLRFAWTPFIDPMGLNYWLGLAMGHEF